MNTLPANDSPTVEAGIDRHLSQTELSTNRKPPRCGLFCWRPDFLQFCYNWKLGIAVMCYYAFIRGLLTNGMTALNTASFEKRFNVDSTMIGWFSASNKLALSSTTVIFSYYADRTSNKPRMLALSAFINTFGSLLMALPHFIMEPYRIHSEKLPAMCYLDDNYVRSIFGNTTLEDPSADCDNGVSSYFGLLIAGNIVKGVAVGIYVGVGIAFIDDFSTMASSTFNIGATYLCMSIGTAVGFGAGAGLLKIDVNCNIPSIPQQNTSDPSFLGAWWLAYVISIVLFGTVAIVFLFFDDELPETAKLREEKLAKTQTHVSTIRVAVEGNGLTGRSKLFRAISVFFDHFMRLLTNPVLISVTIAHILSQLAVGGMQPFLAKILQTLYGLGELSAGMVMGVLILIGIAAGTFMSGYVAKRMEMSPRSMLLLAVVCILLATALSFFLALTCSQEKLVGVTYNMVTSSYYPPPQSFNSSHLPLSCNANCGCHAKYYSPVCDTERNLEFFSACYAGCQHFGTDSSNNTDLFSFNDCTCLQSNSSASVKYGLCDTGACANMYVAMIGIFLMLFCGFFILVPVTEVIIRTVPLEERSFSLAFSEAMTSFLGAVPAPLFMGTVFDLSCIMFKPDPCGNDEESTKSEGACVVYNPTTLSWWLVGMLAGSSFLSSFCYLAAFVLYKPPSGEPLGDYFRSLGKWWQNKFRQIKTCCQREKRRLSAAEVQGYDGPYTITPLDSLQSPPVNGDAK